jgi:uncharacterized protein (TIGR03435 family)
LSHTDTKRVTQHIERSWWNFLEQPSNSNEGSFMRCTPITVAFVLALLASPSAQKSATFDVASIREHQFAPGSLVGVEYHAGGRFTANAPIPLLITSAYNLLPAQLSFAPGVLDARQPIFYDIEAKAEPGAIAPGPLTRDGVRQMQLMLRQLLADRFKLRIHTEKKELPVYILAVDRAGLKLQKAPARDCDGAPSTCGWKKAGPASGVVGYSVRLDGVAGLLSLFLDRSVVDRTNVTDAFDLNLPPFSRGTQLPGATADGVPVDVTAPSVFAVLRDVGLRLEPHNELLEVYVVDSVERPTVN